VREKGGETVTEIGRDREKGRDRDSDRGGDREEERERGIRGINSIKNHTHTQSMRECEQVDPSTPK
jgi:hypothetical protein